MTPRPASSDRSCRRVTSGVSAMRESNHCLSPKRASRLAPPIGLAAALPVSRIRLDQVAAHETLTANTAAALRQVWPFNTADATRNRRSPEYGRVMQAGPLISQHSESDNRPFRNPDSVRNRHALEPFSVNWAEQRSAVEPNRKPEPRGVD